MHTIRTRVRVRDLDGVSPHESRSGPKLLRRWPPMMRIAAKAGILSLTAVPSREARERTPAASFALQFPTPSPCNIRVLNSAGD
jgi:hypothetical protein